jgi:formate hydrogenlyase subunit 3/multisubunit Na+/H+ antiporter MnhD subunit
MFSLLPLLTLIVPTFVAVLCLFTNPFWFLKPFFKRIEKESLLLGTCATLAIVLLMVPDILADRTLETPILFLKLDYSNALGMVVVAVMFVLTAMFNVDYEKGGRLSPSMYNFFVLLFEICMLGLLMAYDMFLILVFVELTIGVSIVLVVHSPIKLASESAFKYLILTAVSALFVIFAVLLVYILTGTSDLTNIGKEVNPLMESPRLILLVVASFIIGLGVDIGLVPFHGWAPDVFPASTPVVNGFYCAEPVAFILALYKLVHPFYMVYQSPIIPGLMVGVGALSVLTGVVMAYSQTDSLRMMAYTSIEAFGLMLLAFGLFTPLGFIAGQFYLMNAALMKMGMFLTLGAVYYHTGTNDMGQLGGLIGKMRPVAVAYVICALSVAGVPPLSGFFAKWLLYNTLNEFLLPYGVWVSAAVLIALVSASMVSGVYLVRSFQNIFLGPLSDEWKNVKETPLAMWLPAAVVALLAVVLGMAPGLLLSLMGYP